MIKDKPTLLETFSYIYFFPSAILGPSFEFSEFRDFIYLKGNYGNIPKDSCIVSGLYELGKALVNIISTVVLSAPLDFNYCASEDFGTKNIFYKVILFQLKP
jgi:lysophospholipid acyltransferase